MCADGWLVRCAGEQAELALAVCVSATVLALALAAAGGSTSLRLVNLDGAVLVSSDSNAMPWSYAVTKSVHVINGVRARSRAQPTFWPFHQ